MHIVVSASMFVCVYVWEDGVLLKLFRWEYFKAKAIIIIK